MAHDPDRGLDELLRRRGEYIRRGIPAEVYENHRWRARQARLAAMRDAAIAAGRGLLQFWQWVQRRRAGRLLNS